MLLTIGIPVKNEATNIPELKKVIEEVVEKINKKNIDVEIIINDNNSNDDSLLLLESWQKDFPIIRLFSLKNTISFQASIKSMMSNANGDAFVVYQSDLQDPAELILAFIDYWLSGYEIVAGVITKREEFIISRLSRIIFYRMLKIVADDFFIAGFQDFYLISRRVYSSLVNLPDEGLYLRGHISSKFDNIMQLPYQRNKRVSGSTSFNFARKYSLALDAILLFGTRFIRILSVTSFLIFIVSTFLGIVLGVSYILGYRFPIKGWASISLFILTLISIIGLAIGLILEYLIRIYKQLIFYKN